ncbi:MAG: adenylate kinase [Bacteroidales bacterium]|nr:adenylate kinase [Bacteroidales bacterium]
MNIIMFGAPGAGKGTHAKKLAKQFNLIHISTGDLFRAEAASGSELGQKLQAIMNSGALVDDATCFEVLEKALARRTRGIIFDGFPRTVRQAEMLDELLSRKERDLSAVICINVPQDELVRRIHLRALISKRADDNEATIRARLKEYEEKTLPVLDYYKKTDLIININGQSEINETSAKILTAINHRMGLLEYREMYASSNGQQISSFYGVLISISPQVETPHFIAWYGEYRALISLTDDSVKGEMSLRGLSLITEWMGQHRAELLECYQQVRRGERPNKIAPLK